MEYKVTWTIDLDADSPEDAARTALKIQRDPDSWATHFHVQDAQGEAQEIDLGCPAEPARHRTVHVLVPMEDGMVRDVKVFASEEAACQAEREWLAKHDLADDKEREHASDWGTGVAAWECEVE